MFYNKIYEAINTGLQKVLVLDDGDSPISYQKSTINTDITPFEYRFVDMGTDVLWAEYNLGASPGKDPEDWHGDYYAWGETETKSKYGWRNYQWSINGSNTRFNKYNEIDKLTQILPEDDAATVKLGGQYRMPNKKDFSDLFNATIYDWVENYMNINNLNGLLLTSKNNGNTLFFPAAGIFTDSVIQDAGKELYVWSSSIYQKNTIQYGNGYILYFNNKLISDLHNCGGCRGLSVRAVKDK